jgi:hypothetical protein
MLNAGVDPRIFDFTGEKSWGNYDLIVEILDLGVKIDTQKNFLSKAFRNIVASHARTKPDLVLDFIKLFIERNIIDVKDKKVCSALYTFYMEDGRPSKSVVEFMIENFEIAWNYSLLSYLATSNDPVLFDVAHKKSGLSDTMALLGICQTIYTYKYVRIDFVEFLSNFSFNINSAKFCKYIGSEIFHIDEKNFRAIISQGVDFASQQAVVLKRLTKTFFKLPILVILQEIGLDFAAEDEIFIKHVKNRANNAHRLNVIKWLRENGYRENIDKYTNEETDGIEYATEHEESDEDEIEDEV